jgi:hypothetical protein
VYLEPFLGAGAVMRMKRPARVNIGVDLDPDVVKMAMSPGPSFKFVRGDGIDFLASYPFSGTELVYCDPPYLMSTRRTQKRLYRFEMTDVDHRRLLRVLQELRCMVMISGYSSPLYARELKGWNATSFHATTRGAPAAEWVWYNFPPPAELHDYRYLGINFRERERIKRKKRRWTAKLEHMPALERQALLAAIAATAESGAARALDPLAASGEGRSR